MKSAIISVGTELLFGQIVNTNAAYLSWELNGMGVDVLYHYTMGDNPGRLKRILEFAGEDCELFLITGGLGPTEDDLTKETLCEFLGESLILHEPTMERMNSFFQRVDAKMTENNLKQALVPEHAVIFSNTNGMAPGFALEKNGKIYICMPGVPREMKRMFENSVKPYLMRLADAYIVSRSLKVFGIGESMVETMILDFVDGQTDPTIATYAKESEVEIRITSKRRRKQEAVAAVDEMAEKVRSVIGDNVYSMKGEEIFHAVGSLLIEKGITLSLCETATGGNIASLLSRQPGISAVLNRSLVVPAETAQIDELGISRTTLDDETICSEKAVSELAERLQKKTGSRLCVAVTGNAGPDYCDGIEPGTFFVGILFDGQMTVRRYYKNVKDLNMSIDFMSRCVLNLINLVIKGCEVPLKI